MSNIILQNLEKLGVSLPQAAAPAANYVPYVKTGNQLFISGQLPMQDGKIAKTGKVGADLSVEDGIEAARLCAINLLAQAQAATGDLSKIARLVKIVGFVNSKGDFGDQPKVINGASDFLVAAMGEAGHHARSAVSAGALPFNAAVEIEAIFELVDN
ncbi:RidA family protein [Pseudovibrio sp. Tun.PSC04-5.I4]|uniref:RidA family protein n=1 Tax=Pseudovibrio sp. Tun.PSC04-5.I4 TaxID=1798213 RepID=UPI0008828A10|nr:RidA family protein [Pseudovibrio sp. Tun.PSC04-5.I4]SDR39335.1 Enamine deaminase RidA, house cleaning of reactive enamine intermediates, YjgF/YER057c/UK114 family [Pseudovibrio sp. Tun.PSC04-5.I4]